MSAGTRLVVIFEKGHIRKTADAHRYIKDGTSACSCSVRARAECTLTILPHALLDFAWAGYMLGIQLPNAWDKPKEWQLRLKDPNGKTNKKALVVFPQHLVPCAATVTAVR